MTWLALISCGAALPAAPLETTSTSSGTATPSPSRASAYVSLAPHLTEMLFALGLEREIAGVTDFCNYPPAAKSRPRIGALMTLHTEQLIALKPDHIFFSAAQPGDIARLKAARISMSHLPTESLSDITSAVLEIGQQTGKREAALALVGKIQGDLESVARASDQAQRGSRPRVLLVLSRQPGPGVRQILTAGPGTFLHELIVLCGAENVAAGTAQRYPTLGTESLLTMNRPDVIIELRQGDGGGDAVGATVKRDNSDGDRAALQAWKGLFGAQSMPRLVMLDTGPLLVPGPRVGESAGIIAGAIYPELQLPNAEGQRRGEK
jgi:iron complex transport system substrate-binding protein